MNLRESCFSFVFGRFLDTRRHCPHVIARIHDPCGTVAHELVCRCHEDSCACRFGSRYGFVDILDIDVEHDWRAPIRRRCTVGNLWPFALDHDHRRPDCHQRVRRLAVCTRPAIEFDGVECPRTESDLSFGIATVQPRDDCRGALGDAFCLSCHCAPPSLTIELVVATGLVKIGTGTQRTRGTLEQWRRALAHFTTTRQVLPCPSSSTSSGFMRITLHPIVVSAYCRP